MDFNLSCLLRKLVFTKITSQKKSSVRADHVFDSSGDRAV